MSILIFVVIVILVAGILAYLLRVAPFIDEPFKSIGVWILLAIAVLVILLKLTGVAGVNL